MTLFEACSAFTRAGRRGQVSRLPFPSPAPISRATCVTDWHVSGANAAPGSGLPITLHLARANQPRDVGDRQPRQRRIYAPRLGHKSFADRCLLALLGVAFYAVRVHRLAIYATRFLPTLAHPHAVALHFTRCDQIVAGLSPTGPTRQLRDLRQWKEYFHRFERHGNASVVRSRNQSEFF